MTQTTFTAKEAKNNFGRLLDEARRSPVAINKNGRKVAFVISNEDYSHYEDFQTIVDAYWGRKAKAAMKEGSIGLAKSKKLLNSLFQTLILKSCKILI